MPGVLDFPSRKRPDLHTVKPNHVPRVVACDTPGPVKFLVAVGDEPWLAGQLPTAVAWHPRPLPHGGTWPRGAQLPTAAAWHPRGGQLPTAGCMRMQVAPWPPLLRRPAAHVQEHVPQMLQDGYQPLWQQLDRDAFACLRKLWEEQELPFIADIVAQTLCCTLEFLLLCDLNYNGW
jgi:hypothetical protein